MNRYFGLHTLEGEWHALLPRYMLLADRVKDRRILDIGCGTGIGSSLLLELGAQMVDAIDHRPAVLELGRMKHAKDGLDFHVMFWEELDFPNDTFDMVLCLDPASPVTDPSLIQEVRRVLKPGGEYVCAVERKTIDGFEAVLPRYGYTEAAESVDINQSSDRVPQIGELDDHFDVVRSIVQRPVYAFMFDLPDKDENTPPEQTRKSSADDSGVWIEDSSADDDRGRWLSVDMRLCAHDMETGSVELFFCGGAEAPAPPLREIHMPYYSIVERLRQVVGDLQESQVREAGDDDSIFDEVVDSEEEEFTERRPTSEFQAVGKWDREPTMIRQKAIRPAEASSNEEVTHLQAQVSELSGLYTQVRDDFQRMMNDASQALQERDSYIEHLVSKVHDWETRFTDQVTPTNPVVPTPAERIEELEAELARMRDAQRRLEADLEAKSGLLANEDEIRQTNELEAVSEGKDAADADAESNEEDDAQGEA